MRQHACSFTPASSGCSASLTVTSINFWELHQHVVYAMKSCQQRGPTCKSAGTQEGRWPMQLQLQLRFMGPGVNSDRLWARTTAFPAPTLAHTPSFSAAPILQVAGQLSSLGTSAANGSKSTSGNSPRSDRTAGAIPTAAARSSSPALIQNSESAAAESFLKEHSRSGAAVGAPPGDALEAAVRANVMALCRTCSVQQPPSARLVEVRCRCCALWCAPAMRQ